MTSSSQNPRNIRWRFSRNGRRAAVGALGILILAGAVSPVAGDDPAVAARGQLTAKAVPSALSEAIVAASLSCPALNPSRLSAQIMEASHFATDGERGVAGLSDDEWRRWRPAGDANRADSEANVYALAHRTCDAVGQLRGSGLNGDLWLLAMAANKNGIAEVERAKGIPASARSYVDRLEAYARWYADQEVFRVDVRAGTASQPLPPAVRVPEVYVGAIREAGQVCEAITAPRVAAQLMAMSAFDPNLRSPDGDQGIAQFSPDLWRQYRTSESASEWRPDDAIPALGMAMCDLEAQLRDLDGGDAYRLALAAFQWGDSAVRAANGVPRVNLPQLSETAVRYVSAYGDDVRLSGRPTSPPSAQPSPQTGSPTSGGPTNIPVPAPSDSPSKQDPVGGAPTKPAAQDQPPVAKPVSENPPPAPACTGRFPLGMNYQLLNEWTNAIAELPKLDVNTDVGAHVQLWQNRRQKDQYWRLTAASDAGYVVFVNAFSNLALGLETGGTWNGAKVLQVRLNPADRTQQWCLEEAGGGTVHIRNHATGKVLEILGSDVPPTKDDGTWNGHWVEQWDLKPAERDQRWRLVR
ncbi:RICIN domain-containing protein [Micromonospora sp. NPDC050397]|uniref:RICIN domain-containing protein n=1 Tax=Micromonospora sp. NPDC050397 TaxID=3364279 RepID=UPI00384D02F2